MSRLTLALDVMGGDIGPRVTIPAISLALDENPMLSFLLYGEQSLVIPLLNQLPIKQRQQIEFVHTPNIIADHLPYASALRQSKNSSMRLAIEAVKKGMAQGCLSGGNTGALMGLAKLLIDPLPAISRPALCTLLPTINGKATVMLDLGANIAVDEHLLVQFAEMGHIFAKTMLHLTSPRLALLNIGTEENKGYPAIRQAHQQLKIQQHFNYIGFIESDKLMNNIADIIVCDGFNGNIALKTLEGTAKNILKLFKESEDKSHWCNHIKHYILRILFSRYYQKLQQLNPDRYNGASLLGLSSVIVKSHGSANIKAFYYAIKFAVQQLEENIPSRISQGLARLHHI